MKPSIFLDSLSQSLTRAGRSPRTIKAYRGALARFLAWITAHPQYKNAGTEKRLAAYLSELRQSQSAPATLGVELTALLYAHRTVLGLEVPNATALRSLIKTPHIQVIPRADLPGLFENKAPAVHLALRLIYGTGMTPTAALHLRLRDLDFSLEKMCLRHPRSGKDHLIPMPSILKAELKEQVNFAVGMWREDHVAGYGVHLPRGLEKQSKKLATAKEWYWLFPGLLTKDSRAQTVQRFPLYENALQLGGVPPIALSHSFAVHFAEKLLESRFPPAVVESKLKEYLGHVPANTLKQYLHLAAAPLSKVSLPIDQLTKLSANS